MTRRANICWTYVGAALLAAGCTWPPPEPEPPPLPPPDGAGDCSSACQNLESIDPGKGCGMPQPRCEKQCAGASKAEAKEGIRYPVGCLTAAKDCDEAGLCE